MVVKTSVGLEITAADLRIAVVRLTLGKLRLMQTAVVAGFVQMAEDEKQRAVTDLVKKYKISPSRVHLSLPRDQGIVRQIDFPVEVREKLRSAVDLQIETLSPWPASEVYWDFCQSPPAKGVKTFSVTISIIPRAALDPWIALFKSAGLPLSGAALSSIAGAHGASMLWPEGKPTIILGCEPGYVEGALIQGGKLSSLTVHGTETAVASRSAAERLLSIGRIADPDAVRLVVHGSTASVIEAPPITIPLENAKPDSCKDFAPIAAAFGGLKGGPFKANLVPLEQRYRRSQLQLIPTYILIGLTLLMGVAMLARESYQQMVYASRIDEEIQRIAPEVRDVAQQEAELDRLLDKSRAMFGHLQSRDRNLEAMRELSRILPSSTWLTNYTYQDEAITVSGFAQSASEVQKLVEDNELFKDVQFTTSVTRDNSGKDRFTLRANLEVQR